MHVTVLERMPTQLIVPLSGILLATGLTIQHAYRYRLPRSFESSFFAGSLLALLAPRGRGKSSALGIAAAALLSQMRAIVEAQPVQASF